MKYLPSVEALSAKDDHRLLVELELARKQDALARLKALVARADRVLYSASACGEEPGPESGPLTVQPRGA